MRKLYRSETDAFVEFRQQEISILGESREHDAKEAAELIEVSTLDG